MEQDAILARLRWPIVAVAVGTIFLLLGVPVIVAVTVLLFAPIETGLVVAAGAAGWVLLIGYLMSSSYQWVEIDGDVVRGRRLLTRRLEERPLRELVRVTPLVSHVGGVEDAVIDYLLKTTNRGYELRFHDGVKLNLVRADMVGVDPFMEALKEHLGERWEEVVG